MKKLSLLAGIAALGIAGSSVFPVQAADSNQIGDQLKANGYAVIGGQVSGKLCDIEINWKDCPIITPPGNNQPAPELPDTDAPDTDAPDTDAPDTDAPDTDAPDTDAPDTDAPDTDAPDTDAPDTDQPDTDQPGGDIDKPGSDNDQPGTDNPGTDTEERTFAEQVVDLVNAERAKAGLGALTLDKGIESAALVRAKEIEVSFSHTRPNGSSFSTVLSNNGIPFRGSGENIAWGQRTPEEVMNSWMNSEGHKANILDSKFTKIGVGYYQNSVGRQYWTQLFTY